ncbi:MAG: hypothetical protein ABIH23_16370 [bacterium]
MPMAAAIPAIGQIAGSAIGAIGSSRAAKTQADAARAAALEQQKAAQRGIDWQSQLYGENKQQLDPYIGAGREATEALGGLMGGEMNQRYGSFEGMPSGMDQFNANQAAFGPAGAFKASQFKMPEDWQTDPGYQFRMQQGQKALEASAAAKGGLMSGGTLKALTEYGQGMGAQEYQNIYNRNLDTWGANEQARLAGYGATGQERMADYARRQGSASDAYSQALQKYQTNLGAFTGQNMDIYNRYMGISGQGQQAAQNLAQLGQGYGSNIQNALTGGASRSADYSTQAAAARAGGQMGTWGGIGNAISDVTGQIGNQMQLGNLMRGYQGQGALPPGAGAPPTSYSFNLPPSGQQPPAYPMQDPQYRGR